MEGKVTKILIGLLIILIIATGVVMAYKIISDKKNNETQEVAETNNTENSILTAGIEEKKSTNF